MTGLLWTYKKLYKLCVLPYYCFPGNGDVWHGDADILVNRSVVKVGDNNVSGEPVRKKMRRTDSMGDDETENSSSDESHVSDSVVETIGCRATSQILAQTIVNAFTEVNTERKLANSFIPSFIATSEVIRITMYNCGLESLIMSADLDIFKYDQDKTTLNVSTILNVWYALNFNNYFDKRMNSFQNLRFYIRNQISKNWQIKYTRYIMKSVLNQ
jgi:hypothetical protein